MSPRQLLPLAALFLIAAPARAADVEFVVRVSVAGATVELDGRALATNAPVEVKGAAAPGRHALKVTKDGFQPWEQPLELAPGAPARVEVLLRVAAKAEGKGDKPKAALRLAVYDLKNQAGIDPRVAAVLTEAILGEVRKLERVSAISMAEVKDMLSFEQQRQLLGCDAESCIEEIGGALGVDELVTGSLGALGDTQLVTLRRVDMKAAVVKASVQKRFKLTSSEDFLALVGPSVEELYADHPLRAGRTRGVSQETLARLNPPPLPRWAFYGTAGLAGVAALAGVIYGAQLSTAQGDFDRLVRTGATTPVPAASLRDASERATASASNVNRALVATGLLALACGVEALFTDWHGYRDEVTPAAPAVSLGAGPDGVAVAGRF